MARRKTKIVCTVGPATYSERELERLLEMGMDVARINLAHGNYQDHITVIKRLRSLSERVGAPLAFLQDLAGPKVRIGSILGGTVDLRTGDNFILTTEAVEGTEQMASVSYPGLPGEVKVNDRLLIADGSVELQVDEVSDDRIYCAVTRGGRLSTGKGVNCPAGLFGLPILGEKDKNDLRFGIENEVDYVGLSFVRTGEDVKLVAQQIAALGKKVPIIAKIETQAAIDHFDEILDEADGIMIARGDLSIETPFARVPVLQKELIRRTNQRAKPVITATQMLWSMVENPFPTRAEVADVANAIMDGSDAVMLSEETAIGKYPSEAVRVMSTIAEDTEAAGLKIGWEKETPEPLPVLAPNCKEEVARVACELASRLELDAIATLTLSGEMARLAAKYRPVQPIIAATPKETTRRSLALIRGVVPLLLPEPGVSEKQSLLAIRALLQESGLDLKEVVLVTNDSVRRLQL